MALYLNGKKLSGEPHHYSTDEQVVGTWIDGSTVYEKTLTTPTTSTTSSSSTSSEFSLSGVENVVIVDGYVDIGTATLPLNFAMQRFEYSVFTFYDSANAKILNNIVGWTPTAFSIRVRYTKTSSNTRNLNLSKGVEETELAEETEEQEEQEK